MPRRLHRSSEDPVSSCRLCLSSSQGSLPDLNPTGLDQPAAPASEAPPSVPLTPLPTLLQKAKGEKPALRSPVELGRTASLEQQT